MTAPTQRLQVGEVPRIAAPVERHDVIALKPPGPAAPDASPAVAVEGSPADASPAESVQESVAAAHVHRCEISTRLKWNFVIRINSGRSNPLRRTGDPLAIAPFLRFIDKIQHTVNSVL